MDQWLQILAAFAGGVFVTLLGNLLIPLWLDHTRRPKLKLRLRDDWILAQNRQVNQLRLTVINEGKSVARGCEATIRIQNATTENILEEAQGAKPILKSEDFGSRPILQDPQLLCWSMNENPRVLNLNPGIPHAVDVLAFDYGEAIDPKRPPVVHSVIIPSEMGWNPPRAILKPSRYVVWVQVHGENCKPSEEVRFWVRRIGGTNDNHLDVSFTP